jgi:hypothetical protein
MSSVKLEDSKFDRIISKKEKYLNRFSSGNDLVSL